MTPTGRAGCAGLLWVHGCLRSVASPCHVASPLRRRTMAHTRLASCGCVWLLHVCNVFCVFGLLWLGFLRCPPRCC